MDASLRPRAKLSDFGSSDFTSEAWKRERSELFSSPFQT
jgi:hypothetical protein